MEATEIIEYLRERNLTLKADGEYLEISPPEKITEELLQRLRKHKPAILAELKREKRRKKILAMLAEMLDTQHVFITDIYSDPDNVILIIAIRDKYVFEMTIPKHRYDDLALLEMTHSLGKSIESNH